MKRTHRTFAFSPTNHGICGASDVQTTTEDDKVDCKSCKRVLFAKVLLLSPIQRASMHDAQRAAQNLCDETAIAAGRGTLSEQDISRIVLTLDDLVMGLGQLGIWVTIPS